MADRLHQMNPFSKRDEHSARTVTFHKVLTIVTYLLSMITTVYYTFYIPQDDKYPRRTIWGQNNHHTTAFSLNSIIVSIYWTVIFVLQIAYIWHLFSTNTVYVNAAAGVGSHFILNNLLQFGWVMLFVRSHFVWSEVLVVINFFNLSSLYFRHPKLVPLIHAPVIAGPLAFSFVALYWNGAIAVHATSLPARILANIAVWGILVYGLFFLAVFKDYIIGFALSVLAAALGVSQFLRQVVAFQWIFAFTIMAVLFVATVIIGLPEIFGTTARENQVVSDDRERAPLLDDN